MATRPRDNDDGMDPVELLRSILKISKEDAAEVREDAAQAMNRKSNFKLTPEEQARLAELSERFRDGEKLTTTELVELESLHAEQREHDHLDEDE